MSSKKDKFNKLDKKFMNLAMNLAIKQKGLTGPNPSVGCVIVKNKKIISFGATGIKGRPHAESIALKKKKKLNNGATVYVTLEPCSHYGKTPPCTKNLIQSKIKEVNYSINDLDKRSFNRSKKILNLHKIRTKSGLLKRELNFFYKDYKHNKKKNLPYIIGKIACSSNYFILKNNTKITNKHSIKVSHLLRYRNQGILTSYKTVNSDNPKLTCRLNGLYKFSPQRIILDKDLKININTHIVNNSEKIKTIIFHNSNNFKKINKLKFKNIKLIKFQTEQNGYFDLKKIFEKIYKIGITNLLIECGKDLTSNILKNNLFNEFYIFKSSKKLNNRDKISILNIKNNLKNFKNINYKNTFLDKDTLIHYY